MTKIIKGLCALWGGGERRGSDFSEFFSRSSGEKAKVIRQVLREANEDQRKIMREYQKHAHGVQ